MKKQKFFIIMVFALLGCHQPAEPVESIELNGYRLIKRRPEKADEETQKGLKLLRKKTVDLKNIAAALKHFQSAIDKDPARKERYILLGTAYQSLQSHQDAIHILKSSLFLFPTEPKINYLLAKSYFAINDLGTAYTYAKTSEKLYLDAKNKEGAMKAGLLKHQIHAEMKSLFHAAH